MLKKIFAFLLCIVGISSCSKRDPILPGVRVDIFESTDVHVLNQSVPDLSEKAKNIYGDENCEYKQDALNNVWLGDKKIFNGFPTDSVVKSNQTPVCVGKFIYSGLSTGEVIKINTVNQKTVWMADVFKETSLTGGTMIVDIVARVGVDGKYVYAGGLGDAFCKLRNDNGYKIWCLDISVPVNFIVVDNFAFVIGADSNLYAINIDNGSVYWKTVIKKQRVPKYDGKNIIVGKEIIDYKNGTIVK